MVSIRQHNLGSIERISLTTECHDLDVTASCEGTPRIKKSISLRKDSKFRWTNWTFKLYVDVKIIGNFFTIFTIVMSRLDKTFLVYIFDPKYKRIRWKEKKLFKRAQFAREDESWSDQQSDKFNLKMVTLRYNATHCST